MRLVGRSLLPAVVALASTLVVFGVPLAQSKRPDPRVVPHEEWEGPMMPRIRPGYQFRTPAPEGAFGPYLSVQVNVDANGMNILGDAANEPSLAIDPTNPHRIAVGWRQFDNVASNFRQAGNAYSTTGGFSWTKPANLDAGVFRSDPVLDASPDGPIFYNSLKDSFFTDQYRSDNGGILYQLLGPATGGDKQWITVDKTNGPSRGFLYQAWSTAGNNYGGRQFSRSTDGGATWMNPVNIPNRPIWGTLDTGADGTLYLCGSNGGATQYFVRSLNAKNPAVTPTFDRSVAVPMGGSVASSVAGINPVGLLGQGWIACDRSTGPTAGNLYMLQSLRRNSTNPGDVMFVRSTDGGTTWSTPRRLNDDPQNTTKFHWFGTLSVAPNGRIDACWYDTRDSANNTTSALFFTYSTDGGVTWAPNVQVGDPFNHSLGYPQQNKIGDYIGMVSDPSCANILYTATFNGEQDVYFVRVPVAPTPMRPFGFSVVRGIVVSGGLESLFAADGNPLVVQRGPVLTSSEPAIHVETRLFSPTLRPSRLTVNLTDRANTPGLDRIVELFDFTAGVWREVDRRSAGTSDAALDLDAAGTLADYVNDTTAEVRARLRYRQTGPVLTSGYRASIDRLGLTVAP